MPCVSTPARARLLVKGERSSSTFWILSCFCKWAVWWRAAQKLPKIHQAQFSYLLAVFSVGFHTKQRVSGSFVSFSAIAVIFETYFCGQRYWRCVWRGRTSVTSNGICGKQDRGR